MTSHDARRLAAWMIAACAAAAATPQAGAEGTFYKAKREARAAEPAAAPASPVVQAPAPVPVPAPPPVPVPAPVPAPSPPPVAAEPTPSPEPPQQVAAAPAPAPQPAPAGPIAGSVGQVLSTDSFVVAGKRVRLAGIEGVGEPHASALANWLHSGNRTVSCTPEGRRYTCLTSDRIDLARLVLLNGAGRTSADAAPQYRQDEERARREGKGIWRGQ